MFGSELAIVGDMLPLATAALVRHNAGGLAAIGAGSQHGFELAMPILGLHVGEYCLDAIAGYRIWHKHNPVYYPPHAIALVIQVCDQQGHHTALPPGDFCIVHVANP